MAVALGVLVALGWGSADFLGGFTSQRLHTVTVLLVSQSFGLAAAVVLVVALRDARPDAHVFVLSAIAGVVGIAALWLLFRGLADRCPDRAPPNVSSARGRSAPQDRRSR